MEDAYLIVISPCKEGNVCFSFLINKKCFLPNLIANASVVLNKNCQCMLFPLKECVYSTQSTDAMINFDLN